MSWLAAAAARRACFTAVATRAKPPKQDAGVVHGPNELVAGSNLGGGVRKGQGQAGLRTDLQAIDAEVDCSSFCIQTELHKSEASVSLAANQQCSGAHYLGPWWHALRDVPSLLDPPGMVVVDVHDLQTDAGVGNAVECGAEEWAARWGATQLLGRPVAGACVAATLAWASAAPPDRHSRTCRCTAARRA